MNANLSETTIINMYLFLKKTFITNSNSFFNSSFPANMMQHSLFLLVLHVKFNVLNVFFM